MKIIRWFLSHFFLILLIVLVIYGYMFWGNLAGEKTPAGKVLAYLSSEFVEVEEFINAVKARQAESSAEEVPAVAEPSLEAAVEAQADSEQVETASDSMSADEMPSDNVAQQEPPVAVVSVSEIEETVVVSRDIAQQPVSISYSHNQMRVKQNSIGQIESRAEAVASIEPEAPAAAPVVKPAPAPVEREAIIEPRTPVVPQAPSQQMTTEAETASKFVSPQLEQQLNNVDKNGKLISPVLKDDAIRQSWVTARKSFYQRKYELSEQSYRDVINNTSDNFDAYGELGNVYFNQGKNTEAAQAYFEAAAILLRKGQIGRARSLMGLLKHLDKSRAADLQKLIDAAVS